MKKADILSLVQGGILDITTRTLATDVAFTIYKFRKAVRAAHEGLSSELQDLLAEIGVEDASAFDARKTELAGKAELTVDEQHEFIDMAAKLERYVEMRKVLLTEETELPAARLISWEDWHQLQVENKDCGALTGYAEELLEGILWAEPEE